MNVPCPGRAGVTLLCLALAIVPGSATSQSVEPRVQSEGAAFPGDTTAVRAPLPLDVAVSLRRHNARSPVDLSPDGQWIAHTVQTEEVVARGGGARYSDTGFPFSEGNARMEATLSPTAGGDPVVLGPSDAASWAPVWSPDGTRVAFYSTEGGEAGLWVWDRSTSRRRRVSGAVVRPHFGLETPRWSPDGTQILVKVLPPDRTLAEANAFAPSPTANLPTPPAGPQEPSVRVRLSSAAEESLEGDAASAPGSETGGDPLERTIRTWAADLVLVDAASGDVRRLVEDRQVRSYGFSPDGRRVAYAVWEGWDEGARHNVHDLHVLDLVTGSSRTVAEGLYLGSIGYGHEWSWSPDGRRLAWAAAGDLVVLDLDAGASDEPRTADDALPAVPPDPPVWSTEGDALLVPAGGALWSVDPATGGVWELTAPDGWAVRDVVTPDFHKPVAWTNAGGLWVTGTEGDRSGIWALDPATGEARLVYGDHREYGGAYGLAAAEATGEIVFPASAQQELTDLWILDTGIGQARRGSRINRALLGYELGTARRIRWRGTDGQELAGALLLPPGWDESPEPLPLVVWVYGGARGSRNVGRFGLVGSAPASNMQILATRGYAVLYPDAPLRTGRRTEDLVATVLPGVNAAVDEGYADPDHLALMGESFGAINVLALLTRTDRFGAALISAAVTHPDLFADYLQSMSYYEAGQGDMGGTIWEHRDRYRENSPLFDFPSIETPLFIAQGEEDGVDDANAIFEALDRLGKHVEYRIYEGEDHVIFRPANVVDLWERRLAFLARHLGLEVGEKGRVRVP